MHLSRSVVCLVLTAIAVSQVSFALGEYNPLPKNALFSENFQADWAERWKFSTNPKFAEGQWVVGVGKEAGAIPEDVGLIVKNAARHHAISAAFSSPIDPAGKELVVQYEVRLHQTLQCGGAYIKLVQQTDKQFVAEEFTNDTPYVIMFGPDRCGTTDKVHFIFRHKSPVTGEYEEKHLKFPPSIKNDQNTHLYTLVMRPDNTFEVLIDLKSVSKGSLLEEFSPAVNPPKEIDDPSDKKPADWVDAAKIPDADDKKPDDWDEDAPMTIPDMDATKPAGWLDNEPAQVPDPEMQKPADWNDDTDGEWEAPLVDNPKCAAAGCGEWQRPMKRNPAYKGKWSPKMIDNPAYKGEWHPRKIANPNYFEDNNPHKLTPMVAIGIENWTMQDEIEFDNFFIGNSVEDAKEFAEQTWRVKATKEKPTAPPAAESSSEGFMKTAMTFLEEYPVATVATGVVSVVTLLFLLSRLCSKPSQDEDEDDHGHSHEHGDHGHSHSHGHNHSHDGPYDAEDAEEDELKLDTPAAAIAAATAPAPVVAEEKETPAEDSSSKATGATQRKKKSSRKE